MSGGSHLSALAIDELLEGALPAAAEASAREHLAGCAACRRDLEVGTAHRDHFRERVLARTLPQVAGPARRTRPAWWRPVWLLVPAMAAAAALLLVVLRPGGGADPDLAIKGGAGRAGVQVFAQRAGQVFAVDNGAELAAGDQIRFVATPAGLPYLLIASVDGAGNVTVYYPYGGDQSARLDPGASPTVELPGSVILDAAPGPERVYAVFSRQPIAAAEVTRPLAAIGARGADAIRAGGALDIAGAGDQTTLWFEKRTP